MKRLIGRRHIDLDAKFFETNSLEIVNENGYPKIVTTRNRDKVIVSPEEVSGAILKTLKERVEEHLKVAKINDVIVTVPAHFNNSRRTLTKNAAIIAGFQNVHLLNEPNAAALFYNHENAKNNVSETILIYDFGGGTFDVSIAILRNGTCDIRAIDGDLNLGGTDIDTILMKHVQDAIAVPITDKKKSRRLRNLCTELKVMLSDVPSATIELHLVRSALELNVTRDTFNRLCEHIFQETINITKRCMKSANMSAADIDKVLLVGGSSRIPKVRELLAKLFGENKISHVVNPDEAVTRGAAVYGNTLAAGMAENVLKDVIGLSLSIGCTGDLADVIVPKNSKIPCEMTKDYFTARHYQTSMFIKVYQGESLIASRNDLLGRFTISNIISAKRGVIPIDVCFSIDKDGILNVTASERGRQNSATLMINMDSSCSDEQYRDTSNDVVNKEEEETYVKIAKSQNELLDFVEDFIENMEGNSTLKNKAFEKVERKVRLIKFERELDEYKTHIQKFKNLQEITDEFEPI